MLIAELDLENLVLVGFFVNRGNVDDDSAAMLANMGKLRDAAAKSTQTANVLVFVGPEEERPSAEVRRKIAEYQNAIPRLRSTLVTQSTIARGVMRAVGWLTPQRDGFKSAVHGSVEESLRWFEAEARQPLPALRAAVSKVETQLGR